MSERTYETWDAFYHSLMRTLRRAEPFTVERFMAAFIFVSANLVLIIGHSRKASEALGLIMLSFLAGLLFTTYIWRTHPEFLGQPKNVIIAGTALLMFLATYRLFEYRYWFLIPVSVLALLLTDLLGHRVALIETVLAVSLITLADKMPAEQSGFLFVSGLLAIMVGKRMSRWKELALSGFYLTVAMTAGGLAIGLVTGRTIPQSGFIGLLGAANGFEATILVLGTLPILEGVLNLATPGRLLDLTDPSRDLLRRLQTLAPGTYSHSLMVGSMAESATEAIGANAMLARTGALYHDIGKLKRPNFFIENQVLIGNPHDNINPSLSWLTITSHVKDGVEMAEEARLPREVVDIIREHHGTGVVTYFYQKAQRSGRGRVEQDEYRYDGGKPRSREAAVVMICDAVEAGMKAIEKPTLKHAQALVKSVITARMEDGQMSESGLTFADLDRISRSLEQFLCGMVTGRVQDHPESCRAEATGAVDA